MTMMIRLLMGLTQDNQQLLGTVVIEKTLPFCEAVMLVGQRKKRQRAVVDVAVERNMSKNA
jgi:hypothetical protein